MTFCQALRDAKAFHGPVVICHLDIGHREWIRTIPQHVHGLVADLVIGDDR